MYFYLVSFRLALFGMSNEGKNVHLSVLPLNSGWAEWALAYPEFGSSVNPITTRGADYDHHITASPPGFENPAASLSLAPPSGIFS